MYVCVVDYNYFLCLVLSPLSVPQTPTFFLLNLSSSSNVLGGAAILYPDPALLCNSRRGLIVRKSVIVYHRTIHILSSLSHKEAHYRHVPRHRSTTNILLTGNYSQPVFTTKQISKCASTLTHLSLLEICPSPKQINTALGSCLSLSHLTVELCHLTP